MFSSSSSFHVGPEILYHCVATWDYTISSHIPCSRTSNNSRALCCLENARDLAQRQVCQVYSHHAATDRDDIFTRVAEQIEPFNKKGVDLADSTSFAGDLEWDSLTVMDFVAAIEDQFDILITMNMQADIETIGQLVATIVKLKKPS